MIEHIPTQSESQEKSRRRIIVVCGFRGEERTSPHSKLKFPLVARNMAVSGGESRMHAARTLYNTEHGVKPLILMTGTHATEYNPNEKPISFAEQAAQHLTSEYRLAPEDVHHLTGKPSTLGDAESVVAFLNNHPEISETLDSIELITNEYHFLRAWLIFSDALLQSKTGTSVRLPEETVSKIEELLKDAEQRAQQEKNLIPIRDVNKKVIELLRPYFDQSGITVIPRPVEETLTRPDAEEALGSKEGAPARYAQRLLSHSAVLERVEHEHAGIMRFLRGTYTPKSA